MQKSTIISIIISIAIIGGTLYFVSEKPDASFGDGAAQSQNVEIKDGVQYVTITAQGGYFPRVSVIQPNIPTKLIVKTNGTYDCSIVLMIREIGFQKILQPTGEEIIDLGIFKEGDRMQGSCGMGMYHFQIRSS